MAQSSNTLGAHTEGLGQTITFASNVNSGTPQATAGQRGSLRGGVQAQGAQTSNRAQIDTSQRSDGTMQLLLKMGTEVLKPHLEAAQTQQYIKGMQQAAQGNAISDIVADQPWYSKVFGTTSLVDGARAYSSNAVVQNVAIKAEAAMATLRTMSPAEMQQWGVNKLTEIKTGDAGTDALAVQGLSKVLPRIYERQAKENLLWHTENLSKAFLSSGSAGASALTATLSRSTEQAPFGMRDAPRGDSTTEVDKLAAKVSFVKDMAQPPSMPTPTYHKLVVQSAKSWMDSGQLGAYKVFKDSGMLADMPIEYKDHLDQYEERTEAKLKANLPESMITPLSSLYSLQNSADTKDGLSKFREAVTSFNDLARRTLGINSDMFSNMDTVRGMTRIQAAMAANEERTYNHNQSLLAKAATKEDARQLADINLKANMMLAVNGGGDGVPESDMREAMVSVFGKASPLTPNPAFTQMAVAQHARKTYSPDAKNRIAATMNDVMFNADQFGEMYKNKYRPLVDATGDLELATVYFGNNPKHAGAMAIYHANMAGMEDTPTNRGYAHAQAILPPRRELKVNSKGELSTQDEAVVSETKKSISMLAKTSGTTSLFDRSDRPTTAAERDYIGRVADITSSFPHTMSAQEKVAAARKLLKDQHVSFIGGNYLEAQGGAPDFGDNLKSLKAPPDSQGARIQLVPDAESHEAVKSAVDHYVSGMGMEGAQVRQKTGTRPDGQGALLIMGMVDNKVTVFELSTGVIADRWAKLNPIEREAQLPDSLKGARVIPKDAPVGNLLKYQPTGVLGNINIQ